MLNATGSSKCKPTNLSAEIVVLGVEESNEGRVDGRFVGKFNGTLGQNF